MSLLMDALKKAEEEKKRAAKQLHEVEESPHVEESDEAKKEEKIASSTSPERVKKPASDLLELTLAPLEKKGVEEKALNSTYEELEISKEVMDAKENTDEQQLAFSEGMTLENTVQHEVPDTSLEETQEAIDLDDTNIIEGLSVDNDTSPPFDDTFHGVILDDDDAAYEETLPGVSADQLAKDLGGGVYQPTPAAAKTVFSAGRSGKNKSSFKWGMLSVLVLLAAGSFAVFYYFSITPVARQMPPPDVARGIESTPAALPAPAIPSVSNDNVSGTLIAQNVESDELVEEVPVSDITEANVEMPLVPNSDITEQEQLVRQTTEPKEVEPIAEIEEPVAPVIESIAMPDDVVMEIAETPIPKQLPKYIDVDQEAIQISKNTRLEQKAVIVSQGFAAYKAADYQLAKSLYQDALRLDADNRDARLGLAAIALKRNELQEAFAQYNYLLELNPDDALALTAMQSLSQNSSPTKGESTIKLLLQKEGDNPYLYFNLGNLYARQKRWPEAQQAFFDAYRLENDNAGYALNLAISLDHLEQYTAAFDHYQSALSLAAGSDAGFDYAAIQQRVNSLATIIQGQQ